MPCLERSLLQIPSFKTGTGKLWPASQMLLKVKFIGNKLYIENAHSCTYLQVLSCYSGRTEQW